MGPCFGSSGAAARHPSPGRIQREVPTINAHTSVDHIDQVDQYVYSDDSGIPKLGLGVHSSIAVEAGSMSPFEKEWLRLRQDWYARHHVPVDYELHANRFLGGRGRPGGMNPAQSDRRRMAQSALDLIGDFPGITVTSAYSYDHDFRAGKRAAFAGLLRSLDATLVVGGWTARMTVDGDGTDRLYEQVHADVRPIRIAHPIRQVPAHESLWLQAADLVAYTACQAVARRSEREFMWHWYARHLTKFPPPREA